MRRLSAAGKEPESNSKRFSSLVVICLPWGLGRAHFAGESRVLHRGPESNGTSPMVLGRHPLDKQLIFQMVASRFLPDNSVKGYAQTT
jgi:hypothetical protein